MRNVKMASSMATIQEDSPKTTAETSENGTSSSRFSFARRSVVSTSKSFLNSIQSNGSLPVTPFQLQKKKIAKREYADDAASIRVEVYKDFPVLQSLLQFEQQRVDALYQEGKAQIDYPKSNVGWIKTIFMWKGRALDWIALPWCVIMLHATIYTILQEVVFDLQPRDNSHWEIFYGFVLNATLAFLLVFRLNRAANRFWGARAFWGVVVASIRSLVGGLMVHVSDGAGGPAAAVADLERPGVRRGSDFHLGESVRWLSALPLVIMHFLRGEIELPADIYGGILTPDELKQVVANSHYPLYVGEQVRYHLKYVFRITAETPMSMASAWSIQLDRLEVELNQILDACGGMERISGTPLPIVYVSHLRTFLLIDLLIFPYVFGPAWGWGCIPIVALSAFALLGIEASASEVECPFHKDRVNALNMDKFCEGALSNILQTLKNHVDRIIARESVTSTEVKNE